MNDIKKILHVTLVNLNRNIISKKIITIFILFLVANYSYIFDLKSVSEFMGININYAINVFLLNDIIYRVFVFTGILFYFSNLPFDNTFQVLLIERIGKRGWQISSILYIVMSSVVLVALLFVSSLITIFPRVYFGNQWGRFIYAYANSTPPPGKFIIKSLLLNQYDPLTAMSMLTLTLLLLTILFGMLTLAFNNSRRNAGTTVCAFLIFLQVFIEQAWGRLKNFVSPINWLSLGKIAKKTTAEFPSFGLTSEILALLILILIFYSIVKIRKNSEILIR